VKDILIQCAASKGSILMRKKYFAHTMRLVIIIPSSRRATTISARMLEKVRDRYRSSMRDRIMD